jgi:DNA-binding GntR family transcriptional regulator
MGQPALVGQTMPTPLYANLARDLQVAIAAGHHEPGSLLPGEIELAEIHRVSRATVRAALDLLEKEGLVERRRGAGTRVLRPRPAHGFGQSVLSIDELIHYARDTRRVVRSVDDAVIDLETAANLGIAAGSRWLRIQSLRIDGSHPKRPICASESYVAHALASVKHRLDDETTALCDLLARHHGVLLDRIEQEMRGAVVPAHLAEPLAATVGDPALRILRRYVDASGDVFLVTVGLHPADRFAYRMRLDRSR